MTRLIPVVGLVLVVLCVGQPWARAQMVGLRGVAEDQPYGMGYLDSKGGPPYLDRYTAEGLIMIDGRAEVRVRPTEIRVVLAVTGEGKTAQECRTAVYGSIDRLKQAWSKIGIPADRIVVDFIAVIPQYEWTYEERDELTVGVEKRVGYRMQTNVHLAAHGDAEAESALSAAFEQGITDIIAFDYWSKDLDEMKRKARQEALDAARGKADVLLGALFEKRPPVINVQEQTAVQYPESLYHSFEAAVEEKITPGRRDSIPYIHAYRPRNTYYRGLMGGGDVTPRELPMRPEISVVSTVRLYFQSPAAEKSRKEGRNRKRNAGE